MNKEVRITVRLTPEQYESIRARADTAQLSPSAYIRYAGQRPATLRKVAEYLSRETIMI